MIQDTIRKIEARISQSNNLNKDNKDALIELVQTLRQEVQDLSKTHDEQAQSITRFAEVSAHEATRQGKDPKLLDLSVKGLESSVEGFEKSHPKLVALVNRICTTLSNLGV